ncbi:P-loop containing nucleoside triphosphate hydrolase [Moorella glycerini]|uniref:Uncharacterized protein n=1 Tax=Neomoorella stamsii TaxID=1266720 RepID=A0A9X7J3N2_9FIRM|nr:MULTISPECIES: hypothetical protein [Moorella]PRR74563.1 hypothetical protein MOST_09980 [Moorella stamsii]CEP69150.1 P-loop containing nucleoside triphosphate hydrolase [Moorella glycerini]
MAQHIEEIAAAGVPLRVDVVSERQYERVLQDEEFLNYRLAGVRRYLDYTLAEADLTWYPDAPGKRMEYDGKQVILYGQWYEGEIQRLLVSLLARKMFKAGLYLFHASAVHYRGKNIAFIGGESNSGKTMAQIEACRRGGAIISTETIVTDASGRVVMGSKNVFLRQRAKGTERIDKPNQDEGVAKFFSRPPEFTIYEGPAVLDLVILPDIDGNYAPLAGEMAPYERQYQTFHCLCDYLGMHILLAPGLPMPLLDDQQLRVQRANFIEQFTKRPYYYIRGANPQVVIDQLDEILNRMEG